MRTILLLSLLFTACTSLAPAPSLTPTVPPQTPAPTAPTVTAPDISVIEKAATTSTCASYNWQNRGIAPQAYMAGMAITFAKAICHPTRPDVQLVSSARFQPESTYDATDALSWYHSNFTNLGMSNDVAGTDVLRHVYLLMLGLGMRESSGQFCCGRDMSSNFSSADAAEAGTFQASWGAHNSAPTILTPMYNNYVASNAGCYLSVWSAGVTCSATDAVNWGTGVGKTWQGLTKECPSFGAEFAAVLIRKSGGTQGEFGPLRRKEAELRPECDLMLQTVQRLIDANPSYCSVL